MINAVRHNKGWGNGNAYHLPSSVLSACCDSRVPEHARKKLLLKILSTQVGNDCLQSDHEWLKEVFTSMAVLSVPEGAGVLCSFWGVQLSSLHTACHDQPRVDGATLGSYCQPCFAQRLSLWGLRDRRGTAFVCALLLQEARTAKCYAKRSLKSWETRGLIWWLPFSQDDQVTLEITLGSGEGSWKQASAKFMHSPRLRALPGWESFHQDLGACSRCGGWSAVVYLDCI